MPYQSIGDLPVIFMMNQFDLSDWYDNGESDLYESIDLIKDYYDEMTDRLRHQILEASPVGYCSGYYEARSASGRANGKKYKAQKVIFRILLAVNRFSWIFWKAKSC